MSGGVRNASAPTSSIFSTRRIRTWDGRSKSTATRRRSTHGIRGGHLSVGRPTLQRFPRTRMGSFRSRCGLHHTLPGVPFEAYIQPPDMVLTRLSSIVHPGRRACAESHRRCEDLWRPHQQILRSHGIGSENGRVQDHLEQMQNASNMLDQQDCTWDYGQENGRVGFGPVQLFGQIMTANRIH